MGIQNGDILELRLVGSIYTEETQNVFQYKVTAAAGTPAYTDVMTDFLAHIGTELAALVSADWSATRIYVRNLTNGIDIDEAGAAITGAVAGDAATSMLAYGFRYNRATAITRHGHKRFAGVDEGDLVQNSAGAGAVTHGDALAAVLEADVSVSDGGGNTATLEPVIVGRIVIPGPGYGSYDLTKVNGITGVTFTGVTSQVSRKAGRGS